MGSEDVLKAAEDYTGVNVDFNWVANDSYNDILGVTLMDKANMPMVITSRQRPAGKSCPGSKGRGVLGFE